MISRDPVSMHECTPLRFPFTERSVVLNVCSPHALPSKIQEREGGPTMSRSRLAVEAQEHCLRPLLRTRPELVAAVAVAAEGAGEVPAPAGQTPQARAPVNLSLTTWSMPWRTTSMAPHPSPPSRYAGSCTEVSLGQTRLFSDRSNIYIYISCLVVEEYHRKGFIL